MITQLTDIGVRFVQFVDAAFTFGFIFGAILAVLFLLSLMNR